MEKQVDHPWCFLTLRVAPPPELILILWLVKNSWVHFAALVFSSNGTGVTYIWSFVHLRQAMEESTGGKECVAIVANWGSGKIPMDAWVAVSLGFSVKDLASQWDQNFMYPYPVYLPTFGFFLGSVLDVPFIFYMKPTE